MVENNKLINPTMVAVKAENNNDAANDGGTDDHGGHGGVKNNKLINPTMVAVKAEVGEVVEVVEAESEGDAESEGAAERAYWHLIRRIKQRAPTTSTNHADANENDSSSDDNDDVSVVNLLDSDDDDSGMNKAADGSDERDSKV